jgi:hypothetical protein
LFEIFIQDKNNCSASHDTTLKVFITGIGTINNDVNNIKIYPNPFKEITNVAYSLLKSDIVSISLIDLLGRETIITSPSMQSSGQYQVAIDATKAELDKAKQLGVGNAPYFFMPDSSGQIQLYRNPNGNDITLPTVGAGSSFPTYGGSNVLGYEGDSNIPQPNGPDVNVTAPSPEGGFTFAKDLVEAATKGKYVNTAQGPVSTEEENFSFKPIDSNILQKITEGKMYESGGGFFDPSKPNEVYVAPADYSNLQDYLTSNKVTGVSSSGAGITLNITAYHFPAFRRVLI